MRQVRMVSVIISNLEAPCVATHRVSRQKSAEGIVVLRDEGPNGEVSGGLYVLEWGDESVRRSHCPARHGNNPPRSGPRRGSGFNIRLRPDDFFELPRARPSEVPLGQTRMRGGVGRDG